MRFLTRLLDGFYYRHDLYGADGRPVHTKVMATIGTYLAWGAAILWGLFDVQDGDLSAAAVAFAIAVLSASLGHDAYKTSLKTKVGGVGARVGNPKPDMYRDDERGDYRDREPA